MVSNSAKLDRRTKQHTQFGVSASNGSRHMARTKSWRKKKTSELHGKQQCTTRPQESLRVTVPEIWPGQNLAEKKKKKMKRIGW